MARRRSLTASGSDLMDGSRCATVPVPTGSIHHCDGAALSKINQVISTNTVANAG